eukprot:GHVU01151613.1.p1 GENE.GHVU01151613.1~~GHVU01151613.1.p1  ORF type:complete len:564 (-),score=80.05 GHVU01151613.1:38-1729(-)
MMDRTFARKMATLIVFVLLVNAFTTVICLIAPTYDENDAGKLLQLALLWDQKESTSTGRGKRKYSKTIREEMDRIWKGEGAFDRNRLDTAITTINKKKKDFQKFLNGRMTDYVTEALMRAGGNEGLVYSLMIQNEGQQAKLQKILKQIPASKINLFNLFLEAAEHHTFRHVVLQDIKSRDIRKWARDALASIGVHTLLPYYRGDMGKLLYVAAEFQVVMGPLREALEKKDTAKGSDSFQLRVKAFTILQHLDKVWRGEEEPTKAYTEVKKISGRKEIAAKRQEWESQKSGSPLVYDIEKIRLKIDFDAKRSIPDYGEEERNYMLQLFSNLSTSIKRRGEQFADYAKAAESLLYVDHIITDGWDSRGSNSSLVWLQLVVLGERYSRSEHGWESRSFHQRFILQAAWTYRTAVAPLKEVDDEKEMKFNAMRQTAETKMIRDIITDIGDDKVEPFITAAPLRGLYYGEVALQEMLDNLVSLLSKSLERSKDSKERERLRDLLAPGKYLPGSLTWAAREPSFQRHVFELLEKSPWMKEQEQKAAFEYLRKSPYIGKSTNIEIFQREL